MDFHGRVAGLHKRIAAAMPPLSHLECSTCHKRRPVGNVEERLRSTGWPKCCGYTMTLWTKEEVARRTNQK